MRALRTRDDRGFSLIELLSATGVFALGAVGLVQILTVTIAANTSSRILTEAVTLAEDRMEKIRDAPYGSVSSGGPETLTAAGVAGGVYTRSWTVVTGSPVAGCKEVTVVVSWNDHGNRQVRLWTIVRE